MKKSDTETVYCCACRPFKLFSPPNAAQQAQAHYASGKHDMSEYGTGSAVRVD